jgi:cupin fold WbuC family metalloprotein
VFPGYPGAVTAPRIQLVTKNLVEHTIARALACPRRRANHNFHADAEANPHRFLNAFVRGTYCAPHRHADPPKPESFIILSGQLAVFIFDDRGAVETHYVLSADHNVGIDLPPGVWHTLAPLTETAVCFEVKPGPYSVHNDKEFASFAPLEGDAAADAYLQTLLRLVSETRATPP